MATDPADVARRLIESLRAGGDTGLPCYDDMSVADRWRWLNAIREADAGGPFLIRAGVCMDLGETAFTWARAALGGVPPSACTVVHGTASADAARKIAAANSCDIVEVPGPLMRHRFGWAVVCAAGCAWSEGFD